MSKLRRSAKMFRQSLSLQFLMLPGLIYFFVFCYIPMYGVIIAFKDYSIRLGIFGSPWVGLKHFVSFITNPYFGTILRNTVVLSLFSFAWSFWPPIVLALFLNEPMNGTYKKTVQTISYIPHFISTVAVCGVLLLILSPTNGLINNIIVALGGKPIYFIIFPQYFRTIFISSGIWQGIGFSAIIYLAALSSVDQDMYEAATIFGATRLQKMRYISIPSIMPTIVILLILSFGNILSVNTEKVILLYQPTTYSVSDVIGSYIYRLGLLDSRFSFSAAVGLFNNVINVMLVVFANSLARRFTETSLW
ncbi:MAG: ABC transporter permease subunit [Bacillota bacterium]|nr:ABC transporter permease subunit [Bacillota bacterium]